MMSCTLTCTSGLTSMTTDDVVEFACLLVSIPVLLVEALYDRLTRDPFDDFIADQRRRLIDLAEGE